MHMIYENNLTSDELVELASLLPKCEKRMVQFDILIIH